MLRINVEKDNSKFKKITFIGHANYSKYGTDIVCAAASATMLTTVNAILSISNNSIKLIEEKDKQTIKVIKQDDITEKLLINMLECLKSIEKQYPKNIKIK